MEEALEAELAAQVYKSGHHCHGCMDAILYTDEVYLLQVVYAQVSEQGLELIQLPQYEPLFLDFSCWENLEEDLYEKVEDTPPILDDYAVLECSVCSSGIRALEVMGLATYGELHCSQRVPNGILSTTFETVDQTPTVICISCAKLANDEILELWADLRQGTECDEGVYFRCWRYGCDSHCIVNAPNARNP